MKTIIKKHATNYDSYFFVTKLPLSYDGVAMYFACEYGFTLVDGHSIADVLCSSLLEFAVLRVRTYSGRELRMKSVPDDTLHCIHLFTNF